MSGQPDIHVALQHHQAGRLAEAEALYRQILAAEPQQADALHLLGAIHLQVGRHQDAAILIGRAISIDGKRAEFHGSLGLALAGQGNLIAAIGAYQRALALRPEMAQIHSNLGAALQAQGQFEASRASYVRALALRPEMAEYHFNLANVLRQLGDLDPSIAEYRRAIELNPSWHQAYVNLGAAIQAKGNLQEAVAAYRQAVSLRPDFAPAHRNLGRALRQLNQYQAAIHHCRAALALEPNSADDFNTLGSALRASGDLDQAVAAYTSSMALQPDRTDALNNLGEIYKEMGQVDRAIECFERVLEINPAQPEIDSNRVYAMHFDARFDATALLAEHRLWNQRHAEPLRATWPAHNSDRDGGRRLRIGYVSPDLRDHVVGWNLLPLWSHHDRQQFEIFAYAAIAAEDATSRKLRAHCDVWRNIYPATHEEAAKLIQSDKIDILVDLSLHMAHNRLMIFARKPAPVQVTYLGYCSTTGLAAMDYRLSDPYLDPPQGDLSVYSEQTMRLASSYWCYQPPGDAEPIAPPPALKSGGVTFGCMNGFSKISSAAMRLWGNVMAAVADSRLLVHCPEGSHRQSVIDRFAAHGVSPDRLELIGYQSYPDYLKTFHRVDIALDPIPYGGGITTCDGLWMGVPVITLSGNTAVSRGGSSILHNIDLAELAAMTEEDYVRLATEWEKWILFRPALRQRMIESPLMDAGRFARDVEAAYRQMWSMKR